MGRTERTHLNLLPIAQYRVLNKIFQLTHFLSKQLPDVCSGSHNYDGFHYKLHNPDSRPTSVVLVLVCSVLWSPSPKVDRAGSIWTCRCRGYRYSSVLVIHLWIVFDVFHSPSQITHINRLHPISLSVLEVFDNSARLSVENIYLPVVASCYDCLAVICECHAFGICFYWLSSNQRSHKVPRIYFVNIEPIPDVVNYAEPAF